ncbi:folliculin-like isoform X2 [Lycorma delicatula]|uniref:folliculin-like isoform X2 n=1 Tax=Lycorma delicatula TaxID=130591 RepID=UPI003F512CDA
MSAVIAICHFCDQHGPSVLLNTRVQHGSTNYSQECRVPISSNAHSVCSACEMVGQFVSVDQITQVQYVSCQLPVHMPQLTSWLQHICVRSLSCEVAMLMELVMLENRGQSNVLEIFHSERCKLMRAKCAGVPSCCSQTCSMRFFS